ncbi:MAG: T9SS type A sorting domain-containing protein, partial [Candidatus Marinimicrobia bacterium]|nr:T9SS type A sorting domain-containing protein [Candidatus Neomarinimicrobiota bacterium]
MDTLYFPVIEYSGNAPDMGAFESSYPSKIFSHSEFPSGFSLAQNYPNPFNPVTIIQYQIPYPVIERLEIFNMVGQKIEDLINEQQDAGHYEIEWNATGYSSGIYFYRLQVNDPADGGAKDFTAVRRCIFVK